MDGDAAVRLVGGKRVGWQALFFLLFAEVMLSLIYYSNVVSDVVTEIVPVHGHDIDMKRGCFNFESK